MHVAVVARAPDRAEHLAVRGELAGVLHEVGEQPELGRREVDLGAAQVRPVVVEVDDELAVLQPPRLLRGGGRGPPQRRLHPGRQLREATAAS